MNFTTIRDISTGAITKVTQTDLPPKVQQLPYGKQLEEIWDSLNLSQTGQLSSYIQDIVPNNITEQSFEYNLFLKDIMPKALNLTEKNFESDNLPRERLITIIKSQIANQIENKVGQINNYEDIETFRVRLHKKYPTGVTVIMTEKIQFNASGDRSSESQFYKMLLAKMKENKWSLEQLKQELSKYEIFIKIDSNSTIDFLHKSFYF
jgi:hypothetical protein